jgi:fused signal recognition particle receptor
METFLLAAIVLVVLIYFLFFRKHLPGDHAARGPEGGAPRAGEAARRGAPRRASEAAEIDADQVTDDEEDAAEVGSRAPTREAPPRQTGRASTFPAAKPGLDGKPKRLRPLPEEVVPPSRAADVETLRRGLARSRDGAGVFGRLKALFSAERAIDASLAQEIEEVLLSSDVGTSTTQTILARLRDSLNRGELKDTNAVWRALREEAVRMLNVNERPGGPGIDVRHSPTVVLFVGVNGAGKTTTIGKLATQLQAAGKKCVLAAGDTFRAAAVQQLVIWGKRVGCEVVHGKDGADPASVLFEAIKKAEEVGADVVLADTAGRLHTKANLMNEMQKIARSAGKALSGAPHETFLVIDSTNGQNALAQAREFKEALEITGIILTKLDGTAKGGVVLGICDSLRVPVRFVGMGEGPDDLHEFIPERFVDALLGDERAA